MTTTTPTSSTATVVGTLASGFLSLLRDERAVLLGLGATAAGFVCAMRLALEYYRDEVEIKPAPPKAQYITQDTEDALKQRTLKSLLQHYNFSIRETALKIVAGRAVNDRAAVDHLLRGITNPDYDERERCLKALAFAVEDVETYHDPLSVLNTPRGYSALVRSLELCLGDVEHEPLDDPLYDEYYLRDVNERRCLLLVYKLIHKYGVDRLIEARFIERWLAQLPWTRSRKSSSSSNKKDKAKANDKDKNSNSVNGNVNVKDEEEGKNNKDENNNNYDNDNDRYNDDDERRKNFARYLERKRNRISDICQHLTETRAGRRALVRARLLAKSKSKRPPRRRPDRSGEHIKVVLEISMADDEGDNGDGSNQQNENANGNENGGDGGDENENEDLENNDPDDININSDIVPLRRRAAVTDEEGEELDEDDEDEDWDADGHLVPRVVDRSAAGLRLRRRHREAMVFNDGTHPPGRGDIIEREHDSHH